MILAQRDLILLISAGITFLLVFGPGSRHFLNHITRRTPILRIAIAAILIYTIAGVVACFAFPKEITLW
jgi:hypothetical protein